jgi:hypothetical protein
MNAGMQWGGFLGILARRPYVAAVEELVPTIDLASD